MVNDDSPCEWNNAHRMSIEALRLQLDLNEKLVLSALRSREDADEAGRVQERVEKENVELRERLDSLRATGEFRERLLGIIGHDLRNPLNTILVSGEVLLERGALDESDTRSAKRVVNSCQRMTRLIDQLVDFTRARFGVGFALSPALVDLGDICEDVADELRISSGADIRQSNEGDLAGAWDGDRLAQALSNVVGNAVDYASAGTPVLIDLKAADESVLVEVTNHGAPVPPDLVPRLFHAFRGIETPIAAKSGHLGLGLYITAEIVRSHGGVITMTSGDGTTKFAIRLPRTIAPAPIVLTLPP